MSIAVITAPEPLVSLDLAKAHLHVDHGDDDTIITAYVAAASAALDGPDGRLGLALGLQELELTVDGFWTGWRAVPIALSCGPVTEIVSVTYDPASGPAVVLDADVYALADDGLRTALAVSWPAVRAGGRAVRIRYRAGYEIIPAPITAAVLLMTGDLYANREASVIEAGKASVVVNPTVERLLAPYRRWRV